MLQHNVHLLTSKVAKTTESPVLVRERIFIVIYRCNFFLETNYRAQFRVDHFS